jgi:hypothetical protein
LRGLEEFLLEDCRNCYGDPLVTGTPYLALWPCWVAVRNARGAVVVRAAYVSLVAYHTPDHRHPPDGLPAWRRHKLLVELPRDLSHRKIVLDIVSKDAAHDRCLGFVDLEVRGSFSAARNAPIPIRAFPRDHLASTRTPQLAAAISLRDLRAFIFSYHTLYLGEQPGLRIVGKWRGVVKQHRDAMARQLVEHNDLIGVHTGQAIRRQAPDGVEPSGFGGISERVKTGAVQPRTRPPLITVFGYELMSFRGSPLAQNFELRANGSPRFLGLGRDPRVDCYPHRRILWATAQSRGVRKSSS